MEERQDRKKNKFRWQFNLTFILSNSHSENKMLKITQLVKVRFMKVNELKLNQVELFSFLQFMFAAANASELFCMAHLEINERFLYHSNLSF